MADNRTSVKPVEGEGAANPEPEGQAKRPSQEVRKSVGGNEKKKSIPGAGEAAGNEQKKSVSGAPKEEKKSISAPVDAAAAAAGSEPKKSTAAEAPPPPPPPQKPMKPRKSMLDQLLADIPGNRPAAGVYADRGAKELSGKVHNYFSTDDRLKEVEALKPLRRPKLVFDNNYRLSAYNPFHKDRVEKVMMETLTEMLVGVKYNAEGGGEIARKIAEKIRARVMALHFDRYKIVVLTHYGPINRQGIHIGFRFLWDNEMDQYVTGTHKTTYVFCTAAVYGVYFE